MLYLRQHGLRGRYVRKAGNGGIDLVSSVHQIRDAGVCDGLVMRQCDDSKLWAYDLDCCRLLVELSRG